MKNDYTPVFEFIITLISAVISCFLIPTLKRKLSKDKQEQLLYWVNIAVEAAEQLYGSKAGQQKKEYVVAFLLSKGIVFDVDEVTAMIESEVYKLGLKTGKATDQNV
ncbi:MAG: holin [Clostridia bacterium]|nr:holin [Clostridia bacterium]